MINEQFKQCRKEKGINQSKLSQLSGIARSTIWRFETGKHEIKVSSFEKLVNAIGYKIILIDKNL